MANEMTMSGRLEVTDASGDVVEFGPKVVVWNPENDTSLIWFFPKVDGSAHCVCIHRADREAIIAFLQGLGQ